MNTRLMSVLALGLAISSVSAHASKYRCSEVAAHASVLEIKTNGIRYTTEENHGSDTGFQPLLKAVGIPASISAGLNDVAFDVNFSNSQCKKKANSLVEMTCQSSDNEMKLKVRAYSFEGNYEVYDLDTTNMQFKVTQTTKDGYPLVTFSTNFTYEGKKFQLAQAYHMYPVELGHKATCKLQ